MIKCFPEDSSHAGAVLLQLLAAVVVFRRLRGQLRRLGRSLNLLIRARVEPSFETNEPDEGVLAQRDLLLVVKQGVVRHVRSSETILNAVWS